MFPKQWPHGTWGVHVRQKKVCWNTRYHCYHLSTLRFAFNEQTQRFTQGFFSHKPRPGQVQNQGTLWEASHNALVMAYGHPTFVGQPCMLCWSVLLRHIIYNIYYILFNTCMHVYIYAVYLISKSRFKPMWVDYSSVMCRSLHVCSSCSKWMLCFRT